MHLEADPTLLPSMSEIREMAVTVAAELSAAAASSAISIGGGSRPRGLPDDLRMRFLSVRSALFLRGWFDPVLARFDTATGSQASTSELAGQLKAIASSLPAGA